MGLFSSSDAPFSSGSSSSSSSSTVSSFSSLDAASTDLLYIAAGVLLVICLLLLAYCLRRRYLSNRELFKRGRVGSSSFTDEVGDMEGKEIGRGMRGVSTSGVVSGDDYEKGSNRAAQQPSRAQGGKDRRRKVLQKFSFRK